MDVGRAISGRHATCVSAETSPASMLLPAGVDVRNLLQSGRGAVANELGRQRPSRLPRKMRKLTRQQRRSLQASLTSSPAMGSCALPVALLVKYICTSPSGRHAGCRCTQQCCPLWGLAMCQQQTLLSASGSHHSPTSICLSRRAQHNRSRLTQHKQSRFAQHSQSRLTQHNRRRLTQHS